MKRTTTSRKIIYKLAEQEVFKAIFALIMEKEDRYPDKTDEADITMRVGRSAVIRNGTDENYCSITIEWSQEEKKL